MRGQPDSAGARRLTDRQAAVLAAVERLGRPSILELHDEFPALAPSAVARVLASLERKGLVARAGDPDQIYLGGVRWWSTALAPSALDSALAAIEAALQAGGSELERSIDPSERAVTVYLPLGELEAYLGGRTSIAIERIRGCVWRLERDGVAVELSVATRITVGAEARLAVKLAPRAEG